MRRRIVRRKRRKR